MNVERFRRKPAEIAMVLWTGGNLSDVESFVSPGLLDPPGKHNGQFLGVYDEQVHCWTRVPVGFRIAKSSLGVFYPVSPAELSDSYERVVE